MIAVIGCYGVQAVDKCQVGDVMHSVVVECPRMGGGFGGKETQAAILAALAALAATKTGRKVRVRFNRDQDMMITGKRHPFLGKFQVGFDETGLLLASRTITDGWIATPVFTVAV